MQASPLRQSTSSKQCQEKEYSKSIPIARFSFWNLVGLGEATSGQEEAERAKEDAGTTVDAFEDGHLFTPYEREEDGNEEEPESYKRLCYI